jgi:hypothetical protein
MRRRRRICAVGGLLGGRRLRVPVRRKLTLAGLMGVHLGRVVGRQKPGAAVV